jgi:hypothetical protein
MSQPAKMNALLARLFQEPELLMRVQREPQKVFAEAGLTADECKGLAEGSFGALDRIGVHPVLRMHYQMATQPQIANHVTIRDFLPALQAERSPGARHG